MFKLLGSREILSFSLDQEKPVRSGSPVAQTNSSHVIVGTATYLPYGGVYSSTGTGSPPGLGYAGQIADATGLVYMRARYFDPQLRRFINLDPVAANDSTALNFNRHSYASNSPYANYDPSGRCTTSDVPNDDGSNPDDGLPCPGQDDSGSSLLSIIGDALDQANGAMMAMGPVGVEIAGGEELAVAGAAEVTQVGTQLVQDTLTAFEEGIGVAKTSNQLGQEGETAVREAYDIGDKTAFNVNGRDRIADGLSESLDTISEVKNVGSLSYTQQIRDYVDFAQYNGYTFNLYVRSTTALSGPLLQAQQNGGVNILLIPPK